MEMLKIERILRSNTVESAIIHQADNERRWQLTRKQLFVIYVAIPARNGHRLAHHASYGIFCGSIL